jgi:hypothetical protein
VVARPLASAFAHTFTWSLILLGVAFVPALLMALRKTAAPATAQMRSDAPVVLE